MSRALRPFRITALFLLYFSALPFYAQAQTECDHLFSAENTASSAAGLQANAELIASEQLQPLSEQIAVDPLSLPILDETELEKDVQIIWFPNPEYTLSSHTELIVDGVLWNTFRRYKPIGDETTRRRASRITGRRYLSFHLKVSPEELERIQTYLEKNTEELKDSQNCISGACQAVTKNSGIVIPFPFYRVPTLAAIYLTLTHKLGYKRITRIEWVAQKNIRSLFSIPPLYELGQVTFYSIIALELSYALLVHGYSKAQEVIEHLIPILSELP